jgi:hypothetical protein
MPATLRPLKANQNVSKRVADVCHVSLVLAQSQKPNYLWDGTRFLIHRTYFNGMLAGQVLFIWRKDLEASLTFCVASSASYASSSTESDRNADTAEPIDRSSVRVSS